MGAHLQEHHRTLLGGLTPPELDALTTGLTALARVIEQIQPARGPAAAVSQTTAPSIASPLGSLEN
ncbi:MAG: hypothetical protein ACXV5Q_03735 [Frankiaceae bacterium]